MLIKICGGPDRNLYFGQPQARSDPVRRPRYCRLHMPSLPPSRTHVLSCARRARPPPRWRQERLFNTRCDGGVQHQPSRLPAPRRGSPSGRVGRSTRHDTAPNIPRLARVLPALCPQSLLLTHALAARLLCCTPTRAPPVRRAGAKRSLVATRAAVPSTLGSQGILPKTYSAFP